MAFLKQVSSRTVAYVSKCPSVSEYWKSATRCNNYCGSSFIQNETCAHMYHCMRDSLKRNLVEFCAYPKILFGYCPEYDPVGQVIQKDTDTLCNSSSSQKYYNSSDLYFCDPDCFKIDESYFETETKTPAINDGEHYNEVILGVGVVSAIVIIALMLYCLHKRTRKPKRLSNSLSSPRIDHGQPLCEGSDFEQHSYSPSIVSIWIVWCRSLFRFDEESGEQWNEKIQGST